MFQSEGRSFLDWLIAAWRHPFKAAKRTAYRGSFDSKRYTVTSQSAGIERIPGELPLKSGKTTILLCAHWLSKHTYGGERSFLDVLRCFSESGYNLIVTLPNASNRQYIQEIRVYASEIAIFPYAQWRASRNIHIAHLRRFIEIIEEVAPVVVYVNTIMLPVALRAGRLTNTHTIVHAREIITYDEELLTRIGQPAAAIARQVFRSADWIVANSVATAVSLGEKDRLAVIPNAIEIKVPRIHRSLEHVRFGMVSSNSPKKGTADFIKLAEYCVAAEPRARFVLVGPIARLADAQGRNGENVSLPSNLELVDYVPPDEALTRLDVVVNFSHFQESFGRTILEGMAVGLPSIAYNWGALPELIVDGATGFLVPFGDPISAVSPVRFFCEDPTRLTTFGAAAHERAARHYSFGKLRAGLDGIIAKAVGSVSTALTPYSELRSDRLSRQATRAVDIVICVHNALSYVDKCLRSVIESASNRHNIIVVDDASYDDTAKYLLAVAKRHPRVTVIRNQDALGYTRAANIGLRESRGEFVVLLNSDTIVSPGWIEKLADAVFSTPGAGIVGPMSNAAGYQSIPSVVGTMSQTAINDIPSSLNLGQIDGYCERWTNGHLMPYVPLVHGFCLGITRDALAELGGFDEIAFPFGFGEENDYCLRALERGIWPVVATHTFVLHSKTKSYSEVRRSELVREAQQVLYDRYGKRCVSFYTRLLRDSPQLVTIRQRAQELWVSANIPS